MPEIKRPVQTIEVNYVCDKCGYGMMKKVSEMDSNTGDIMHECMICGHPQIFQWRSYPRINYIGLDESIDESTDTSDDR